MVDADGVPAPPPVRPASRVLLLDRHDRLLLLRGVSDSTGLGFWFPVGGGLEPGESAEEAAVREVREETGREVTLGPQVWVRRHVATWGGRTFDCRERWFLARVESSEIDTRGFTADERQMVTRHAWWTLEELHQAEEMLVPADLARRLEALLRDGPPPHPVRVGI